MMATVAINVLRALDMQLCLQVPILSLRLLQVQIWILYK